VASQVEGLAGRSFSANKQLALVQLGFTLCVGVAMALGTAAVVYVGALRVIEHRLLLGDVLVFLSYLGMLYTPISAFAQSSGTIRAARTQLDRVFELLDVQAAVSDRPGAHELPVVRGQVEFRNVTFGYDPARPVLRNVDWTIEPASTVALVGRTGAGKSTLASLLLRSYDPTAGAVLLDGVDLRDLKLEWLRQQVSVVLQDAILFAGTVAENIAFGSPTATRQQIEDAARRANAEEFIRKLPDGYETVLGERGVNLSGGQRQRLAIARAFIKDAPVLVLDEPTAALDAHTESDLVASLEELSAGRTTFIIAHRLSTVRSADLILVLDAGRVVERGTHEELLARGGGAYRELCEKQWGAAALNETEPLLDRA
jgi:ATP-binding cassette subfamily B protein/subfamily B ATP-binding cassette protein MsbA